MFYRVMRQFGVVLQLHFFEDARPIGIDGADTDAQIIRDVFQAFPPRDLTHDLVLAIRQLFVQRFLPITLQIQGQEFRHCGTDEFSAAEDLPESLH